MRPSASIHPINRDCAINEAVFTPVFVSEERGSESERPHPRHHHHHHHHSNLCPKASRPSLHGFCIMDLRIIRRHLSISSSSNPCFFLTLPHPSPIASPSTPSLTFSPRIEKLTVCAHRYWEAQVDIGETIQGWVWWAWKVSSLHSLRPHLFLDLVLVCANMMVMRAYLAGVGCSAPPMMSFFGSMHTSACSVLDYLAGAGCSLRRSRRAIILFSSPSAFRGLV